MCSTKVCIRCEGTADFKDFKKSHTTKNLGNVCRLCLNADARRRRKENPEKRKRSMEKYLSNPENVEKNKVNKLAYSRSEKGKSQKKQWVKDNKEFYLAWSRAYCSKKRAKLLNAQPKWADEARILKIYETCRRISIWLGINHHVDHKVPIQSKLVCGLHCEDNLQIIPAQENLAKNNKWWEDMP